jgi:hypothetical protein
MSQRVMQPFMATGAAVNFKLGGIPDMVHILTKNEETNPLEIIWLYDAWYRSASNMYGTIVASDGTRTKLTSTTGVYPYSADGEKVRVPAPNGQGKSVASVADWAADTSYASGARSTSACGTVVRPPIHNGRIFELTSGSGTATSEPTTWDVQVGQSVTDGGSNVWICREEEIVMDGGTGVTVGTTLADGDECYLVAEWFDKTGAYVDAASVAIVEL